MYVVLYHEPEQEHMMLSGQGLTKHSQPTEYETLQDVVVDILDSTFTQDQKEQTAWVIDTTWGLSYSLDHLLETHKLHGQLTEMNIKAAIVPTETVNSFRELLVPLYGLYKQLHKKLGQQEAELQIQKTIDMFKLQLTSRTERLSKLSDHVQSDHFSVQDHSEVSSNPGQ